MPWIPNPYVRIWDDERGNIWVFSHGWLSHRHYIRWELCEHHEMGTLATGCRVINAGMIYDYDWQTLLDHPDMFIMSLLL